MVLHTASSQSGSLGQYYFEARNVDSRGKEELAEAAVEERDTGLRKMSVEKCQISLMILSTYTEDQDAANNGGVLRGGSLIVDGAQETLLVTCGRVGDDDALGRHGFGYSETAWIDKR